MARYTDSVCRLCRREGQKLFLKGERCYSEKCALVRRNYAPGQHGQGRKKVSEYGVQTRTKQKAKRYYGVLESQFHKYYEMALKQAGVTGDNLLRILESRLDNIVYRAGFANSRAEARQLVTHRHFSVNGKIVNIPSYLMKAGDVLHKTFVMQIKNKWELDNLHLAVFASHGVAKGSKVTYTVCNAVDVPIDAPTPFEYK